MIEMYGRWGWTRRLIVSAACAVLIGSCGADQLGESTDVGTSTTIIAMSSTSLSPTTTATATSHAGWAQGSVGGVGAVMAATVDADGVVVFASEGSGPDGEPLTADATWYVASITKMFTAVLTLVLVDDGLVELDSSVSDYVVRLDVPDEVTVRDCLQHSSRIPDYAPSEQAVWDRVLEDPERVWTPESSYAEIDRRELLPSYVSGSLLYSSSNYLILGVLIEEVTGLSYADALRVHILDPLGLQGTYLAGFETGQAPVGAFTDSEPIDFPYTSVATYAWAAGGLVSSVEDLHRFVSALFQGKLLSTELLEEMTEGSLTEWSPEIDYGLGIMRFRKYGRTYGHYGDVLGYNTWLVHAPETATTAVLVSTNDAVWWSLAVEDEVADYILSR